MVKGGARTKERSTIYCALHFKGLAGKRRPSRSCRYWVDCNCNYGGSPVEVCPVLRRLLM